MGIYGRALFLVGAALAMMTGLLAWLLADAQREQLARELDERLERISGQQAIAVSTAVWDLNRDNVRTILAGLAQDPDFVSAVVRDESGREFAAVVPSERARDSGRHLLHRSEPIVRRHGNEARTLGVVEITLSRERLLARQRLSIRDGLLLGGVLLVTALAATAALLRSALRPLETLTARMLDVADGKVDGAVPHTGRGDQIGAVARAVETFRSRTAENRRLEREAGARLAELVQARDEAEAANRAKSDFLANMSHELRTPLNAIIGFSDAILSGAFGAVNNHKCAEYIGNVRDSGQHLLEIINDILDVSVIEANRLELHEEIIDPIVLGDCALRLVRPRAEKSGVTLARQMAPALPGLLVDGRRVKQILVNLLSNSVKFTPPGGRVELHAYDTEEGGVAYAVIDTGIGMDAAGLAKAFEPFGQVDSALSRRYEGTGLGLPLTRGLAEAHGARLAVASTPGRGTTARVLFPAARSRPPSQRVALDAGDCP